MMIPCQRRNQLLQDLELALLRGDGSAFLGALKNLADEYGMTRLSRETGIPRTSLYRVLRADAKPTFFIVWRVVQGLGLQLILAAPPAHFQRPEERASPQDPNWIGVGALQARG